MTRSVLLIGASQLMRSYAVRHAADAQTIVLMSPGWVQTGLGGPDAPLTLGETIPGVVDTIDKHAGQGDITFVDWQDQPIAW